MLAESDARSHESRNGAARVPHKPAHAIKPVGTARYAWFKAAADFLLALLLLLVTAPLLLMGMLLVKLTSRGPVFYSQTRLGRYGRPFKIYKLRTMAHNCESLTGPRW